MSDYKCGALKIVINVSYGGFELSDKAVSMLESRGALPEVERLAGEDDENHIYRRWTQIPRHDPELVRVVEELGKEACGPRATLNVVEIPLSYEIRDHDGAERVRFGRRVDDWD